MAFQCFHAKKRYRITIFQVIDDGNFEGALIITVSVFNEGVVMDIISTNMGSKDEIRSYLALMARNKPTDKALSIVPIWENLPHNKKIYD